MKTTQEYKRLLKLKYRFNKEVWSSSVGIPFIGYNHIIKSNEYFDKTITKKEANLLYDKDIKCIERFLNRSLPNKIPQRHFDIMVSLCYDIGTKAFKNSSFFNFYILGEVNEAFTYFLVWGRVKGENSQSLLKRRKEELKYIFHTV